MVIAYPEKDRTRSKYGLTTHDHEKHHVENAHELTIVIHCSCRIVGCTRWSELTEGIRFIMNMAHVAQAPTEFRICNGTSNDKN
jgi:hypothetical protein